MDDTVQDTGEVDPFARLLAQLNPPSTDPVVAPVPAPLRAPELRGADELAAPPHPFPPRPVAAPPLIAPPLPVTVPRVPAPLPAPAPSAAEVPARSPAESAPLDFAQLLSAPAPGSSAAPTGAPFGVGGDVADEPDIARSTLGEKLILPAAILLPPLGLLAAIVAAVRSLRRRGWVIGLLRAAIAIGAVVTVVVGIGGYLGWMALQQQQAHDRIAAASAAFCTTLEGDPKVLGSPTFGWPGVGPTIADSLAAMQAYEDRWSKLATVSPAGIRPEVARVASTAKQIIDSVTVGRTVDDASDVALMTQLASSSGVPAWYAEYCG